MALNSFQSEIQAHVHRCYEHMGLMNAILSGTLTKSDLKKYARRHYAEVRTFIDFKLPERLRICPHDARSAKEFFWTIYNEEQGRFVARSNHAELFVPICHKLGITDEELEREFEEYWPKYNDMLLASPSRKILVRELAISFAWESIILKLGKGLVEALIEHYGFATDELNYFTTHGEVDPAHSSSALRLLVEYVGADEELAEIAFEAVTDTLIRQNYFDI